MQKKSRQRKSPARHATQSISNKNTPIPPATHKPWQIAIVCVALVALTIIVFWGVRSNDFITVDDHAYILQNPPVQHGVTLRSIAWAFTTFHSSNWHPLTWISHMVDWSLYNKSPGGHHMTNVLLHAANAVLLFLLLLYMTGFLGRAAMVAFLFAVHPAHVESVAWAAERKEVLCAFFFLITLQAYAWYVRKPSWKRFAWVVCGFACALLSKPMAITLPFTLLLLDYWPLQRLKISSGTRDNWLSSFLKLCAEKWLLFIMAAISGAITFIAQRAGGSVAELQALPVWQRICSTAISYCRYVRIMAWPYPLTAYYYYDKDHVIVTAVVFSTIALICATAVCWHLREKRPYCLVGWLWFLGTLVPVIGIVQVGEQLMAERYTYIPFIGLFIILVWLVADAVAKYPKLRIAAQMLAVAVIITCAIQSEAQVKVWNNTITLFSNALDVDPRGALPNLSLGVAYEMQGRIAEAQRYYEQALVYNPSRPLTLAHSAYCLMQTHDPQSMQLAKQRLDEALQAAPDNTYVLVNLALWSFMMGRPMDEEMYSRKVIAEDPYLIKARLYLGDSLQAQNKLDEAAQEYLQALAIEPDNYQVHNSLGIVLGRQGLMLDALKEFQLSLKVKPDQALPYSRIGRIYMSAHQFSAAAEEFTQALHFEPANINAREDLGVAYYQMGDYEKAAGQFGEVARMIPSDAGARRNFDLAEAQLKNKRINQAGK